jgi:hypothetical protein
MTVHRAAASRAAAGLVGLLCRRIFLDESVHAGSDEVLIAWM